MTLRDFLYPLAFALLLGWMQQRDEAARVETPVPLRASHCRDPDFLGRKLIASYYARSDRMQTLRCKYGRIRE